MEERGLEGPSLVEVGRGATASSGAWRPQSPRAEAREEPAGAERSGNLTSYSFCCSRAL